MLDWQTHELDTHAALLRIRGGRVETQVRLDSGKIADHVVWSRSGSGRASQVIESKHVLRLEPRHIHQAAGYGDELGAAVAVRVAAHTEIPANVVQLAEDLGVEIVEAISGIPDGVVIIAAASLGGYLGSRWQKERGEVNWTGTVCGALICGALAAWLVD